MESGLRGGDRLMLSLGGLAKSVSWIPAIDGMAGGVAGCYGVVTCDGVRGRGFLPSQE